MHTIHTGRSGGGMGRQRAARKYDSCRYVWQRIIYCNQIRVNQPDAYERYRPRQQKRESALTAIVTVPLCASALLSRNGIGSLNFGLVQCDFFRNADSIFHWSVTRHKLCTISCCTTVEDTFSKCSFDSLYSISFEAA